MKVLAFVVYGLVVAYLSLRPMHLPAVEHSDKLLHFAGYFLFSALGFLCSRDLRIFCLICIGIIAYGGLIELIQHYLPYRQMSLYDFLANSAGVLSTLVIVIVARRYNTASE